MTTDDKLKSWKRVCSSLLRTCRLMDVATVLTILAACMTAVLVVLTLCGRAP